MINLYQSTWRHNQDDISLYSVPFGNFYSYLSFPLSTPAFLGLKESFSLYTLLGGKDDSVK